MGTDASFVARLPPWLRGPLLTAMVMIGFVSIERYLVPIPNPPAILSITVVFSAFTGGLGSGVISAAITLVYLMYFFSVPGQPWHYTPENSLRVAMWIINLPATAIMAGTLKKRTLQQFATLEESEIRLRTLMDSMSDAVLTFDEHGVIVSSNRAAEQLFGYAAGEMVGLTITTLLEGGDAGHVAPADAPPARVGDRARLLPWLSELPVLRREVLCRRKDGAELPAEICVTEATLRGRPIFICNARDIRERKRAEEERRLADENLRLVERERHVAQEGLLRAQEQVLSAQKSVLAELSTPLIPVKRRILVMPLVGAIDSDRAARILEVLLRGIADHRAHSAILDVTGVPVIDTQVAGALLRAASAAKMLGARVVLTGIRPEVALALVNLGADLRGVVTCSTLEQGIALAEGQSN